MISIRTICSIKYFVNHPNYDVHTLCQDFREFYNSKYFNYVILNSACQNQINPFDYCGYDNLSCFLERVVCKDTKSSKSLHLVSKNFSILDYFELLQNDNFIDFLQTQINRKHGTSLTFEKSKFKKLKDLMFAEDFEKSPEEISKEAINRIMECIANKNENEPILIIGNHPCIDSCLDLLNVSHNVDQLKREVTLVSNYSSTFSLTNTNFYAIIISDFDDFYGISNSDNPTAYACYDRTETIRLDSKMIMPLYLGFKFNELNQTKLNCIFNDITELLSKQAKYQTIEPEYIHLNIDYLYLNREKIDFNNEYLTQLIKDRWKMGIKSVILTKSRIYEDIYLPSEFDKDSIIIKYDIDIVDFSSLKDSIDKLKEKNEIFIIIKCSEFDKLHFAHLKSFFDHISDPSKTNIHYNIFIIYFGCNPQEFEEFSSFIWPIFAMGDISIHPEFQDLRGFIKKGISFPRNYLSIYEIQSLIKKLNIMDRDTNRRLCHYLFKSIFDQIIKRIDKDIKKRTHIENIDMVNEYEKSDFKLNSDFFQIVKILFDSNSKCNSFKICINICDLTSSTISQIIPQVYTKLFDIAYPFLVLRFCSCEPQGKIGTHELNDYLLRCKYLNLPLMSYLKNLGNDSYNYLFVDYLNFLIFNQITFDENMIKRKCIADHLTSTIGKPSEAKKIFEFLFFSNHYDGMLNEKFDLMLFNYNQEIDDISKTIFLQQYVDYCRFRSFAGINMNDHCSKHYWDVYFNHCIFSDKINTDLFQNAMGNTIKLTRSSMIKSIVEFRNKSIFDIFISPRESIEQNDENAYRIFNEFNLNPESLKSINKINKLKSINTTGIKQSIILSLLIFDAESKWNGININNFLSQIEMNYGIQKLFLSITPLLLNRIKKCDLTDPKFISFGKIWETKYQNLDWNIKGDCLIDNIQYVINKGSIEIETENFRKWFFSGFETDEPLSIIAFRRFICSQTEYKNDFIKVLDPFFSDPRIVDIFIHYVKQKIPENNSFPIGKITDSIDDIMNNFSFKSTFKFQNLEDILLYKSYKIHYFSFLDRFKTSTNTNKFNNDDIINNYLIRNIFELKITEKSTLYRIETEYAYLAQFVWFHVTFNKPSDYPLITLIIKELSFFIDFDVVPKIINSILHLRHIFSYNPVFIPIILHCTSLFDECDCKLLLYSLGYFETANKDFENMQNEINTFKKIIKLYYKNTFEILQKKSSYDQIKIILKIYFDKYNKIIELINEYACKAVENEIDTLITINSYDIMPNMLITSLTLNSILLISLYEKDSSSYHIIETRIADKILNRNYYLKLFEVYFSNNINYSPLFKVSIDNENGKDFIGFSQKDYEILFQNYIDIDQKIQFHKICNGNESLNIHASLLSFLLHMYLNKKDDDCTPYSQIKNVNSISNVHLNTYATAIDYDLAINAGDLILSKNQLNSNRNVIFFYETSTIYPLQSIFKLLPMKLKNKILKCQSYSKNKAKIINSNEDIFE